MMVQSVVHLELQNEWHAHHIVFDNVQAEKRPHACAFLISVRQVNITCTQLQYNETKAVTLFKSAFINADKYINTFVCAYIYACARLHVHMQLHRNT